MKLFLASGNAHKAAELQGLADAAALPVEIVPASVAGGMPKVTEDTGTFAGNARKKALALRARLLAGAWVLADDSGLCVNALGGGPGVESAYYAGPQGNSAANLTKLVAMMRDVPDGKRGAHFICVLCVVGPGEAELCDRPVQAERQAGIITGHETSSGGAGAADAVAGLAASNAARSLGRRAAYCSALACLTGP